ncbi:FAD-dependent oxidoreductase [Streptomyces ureilyticus]|uniref:FAD-dependent oxidoreductase n=1 Tax=Streptomyces ureilyticus TaxID=1775131 RepID=UPI001F3E52EC|nr:FAD-dependent monooxygenase [Streptomyces ureilyticus]
MCEQYLADTGTVQRQPTTDVGDQSQSPGRPRIAVVGGGIGGLAAAAFLRRAGVIATVYEQAPALKEIGAGILVSPNAVRLLRQLGVMDRFLRDAVPVELAWEFRRWENGRVLSVERLDGVCERLYGERTYTVHRADLLDTVKAAVPEEWVRLGARCTAVEEQPSEAGTPPGAPPAGAHRQPHRPVPPGTVDRGAGVYGEQTTGVQLRDCGQVLFWEAGPSVRAL